MKYYLSWSLSDLIRLIQIVGVAVICITLISPHVGAKSFIPDNMSFRPVYSDTLTGYVSPDQPFIISTDIRDSSTGFFRIFGWGPAQNSSDIDLFASAGTEVFPELSEYNSSTSSVPEVITVQNLSSGYLMINPGEYTTMLTTAHTSGIAEAYIQYVYRENIDMGTIKSNDYSVREILIPSGLSRIIFICESAYGTDLDIFIQKGTTLPDSYNTFNYSSTSDCTNCWDTGVDNWIAEMLIIDNPEPGSYLMVTYAHGEEDFFMTYLMGVEEGAQLHVSEENPPESSDDDETTQKYRTVPFRITYDNAADELSSQSVEDMNKAFNKAIGNT
jgi:hypothetical protein